jgi:hypothetical protein
MTDAKLVETFDVYAESELLEVKVPIIFLVTRGFSPRRDGRYLLSIEVPYKM